MHTVQYIVMENFFKILLTSCGSEDICSSSSILRNPGSGVGTCPEFVCV